MSRLQDYALKSLAARLSALADSSGDAAADSSACQRTLSDFAAYVPVFALRMVDGNGRIIASLWSDEITSIDSVLPVSAASPPTATGPSSEALERRSTRTTRIPVPTWRAAISDEAGPTSISQPRSPFYVEAEFGPGADMASGMTPNVPMCAAVAVVLGCLLFAYRRLRTQLRGVHRVADRLQLRRERIEDDLSSLRIVDTLDTVTSAWNRLIESAQGWLQTVQRADANAELSTVLQRANTDLLPDALHAVPDGFLLVTPPDRLAYLNRTAHHLMGYRGGDAPPATLVDGPCDGLCSAVVKAVRKAARPGGYDPLSESVEVPDAPGRPGGTYRLSLFPLAKGLLEGGCLLWIRDVSQQVRADRAREDFVTQVTHELRTPLTNIRAYAETLSSGMFDDPKVLTDCYNVITKETRRLSRLIEDILSVSQLEVGSIELHQAPVDLKSLLTECVRDVRGLADEKNIDVQTALPAKLESLRADRDKLAVVLNNLLGNAIKYTPRDGNIIVGCQTAAEAVMITVKDNGIGIDPADQARIFEKFQRGSDPAALSETGTGIGLYTAREIVRRHGGDIEVISEKGMGSTFMVRLPHRAGRSAAVSSATSPLGASP
jgi:two-component system phosphate regulon sensor histidine kinase PhoR